MLAEYEARRAVIAWRDHWHFYVWTMLHTAGQLALQGLEEDLPKAGLLDVYVDCAAFADARIDRLMCGMCRTSLKEFAKDAKNELMAISLDLTDAASDLSRVDFDQYLPPEPPLEAISADNRMGLLAAGGLQSNRSKWATGLGLAGSVMFPFAGAVATAASHALKPKFHHWLRDAGSKRLAQAWLGTVGDPPPVMPKLAAVIDDFAARARTMLS